ncbi:Stk1 family PASTA domain-containing Ser/Thr kinase [Agreia pratensis]|uniref:Stk1 family PASTA domain-containing Ser/Thr kinase n=1 Tax=Agreia pratensis TaxID=150121 RepID=UPI00188A86FC|nr:Stk1 family PASTA domain-containing Ser/Thr kinase [Agreia pratensis]MBF4633983.1 Stk1 family PASTA domain-containing Ser/Thr kinase [Agreia pratensis]
MTTAPTDPMIGRLIDGRYQVRSRIARGGMATVYLATDLRLERRVAIKIMHGHLADESNFKERFVQEARSAARLAHPNVVNVFDQGQDSDMAYLVMEYLPGMTLRDLLKDYGTLTTEQTLDIMDAVLGGLAAAHKAGIVHRDLKPENVLLADDGRIKIGDFGLSRATSANTATGQALLGTIAYLSPELLTRGTADARSDIYAAGIMMYEMLTGAQPFVGDQPMQIAFQHANDQVPRPSAVNPSVPRDLDDLVLWATAKDPVDRPTDGRAMLEQLRLTEQSMSATQAATTGIQRTVVMPAALSPDIASAQTQSFQKTGITSALTMPNRAPATQRAPQQTAAHSPAAPADRLKASVAVRRRRAFWLVGIVLLLVALAGGTGWYFGIGPGAQLTIPDVAGQAPDAAQSTLEKLGVVVTRADQSSVTVPAGTVIGTDPSSGAHVARDAAVSLIVSTGPAQLPLPQLIGVDKTAAAQAIQNAKFTLGSESQVFSSSAAAGIVLDAYNAEGASLASNGSTEGVIYSEAQPVSLLVSAGAIPDVSNKTVDDATATLQSVGLSAAAGEQVYSDSIKEGNVIQAIAPADTVHPGDTMSLQISRGPEPVTVPDVVGKPWIDAKSILVAAGFDLSYPAGADIVPALVTVTATNPAAGTSVPRGSKLTVSVSF